MVSALAFGSGQYLAVHLDPGRLVAWGLGFVVVAFFFQGVFVHISGLRQKVAQLEKLVQTDDLTGLGSVRNFREVFARRGSGLILFDIDQFKPYNDTHGHPAGDEVLKQLGEILQGEPTVYRLGGDEFAVIVADPDGRTSAELAEFLWLKIRNHPWPLRPITASFGVAWMLPTFEPDLLRDRADQALYQAKRAGGDRICVYSGSGSDG